MSNLKIFETKTCNDTMELKNYIKSYVSSDFDNKSFKDKFIELTSLKIKFLKNCQKTGLEYGFDGKKIIIPSDTGLGYAPGSYFVADEKIYKKGDILTTVKVPGDIVLLKENNPGIVIGYPVSDEPVVIIEDQEHGITALAHCSLNGISKRLPLYAINALQMEADSNVHNLKVYISSNLKKKNRNYILKPKTIKENPEVWKGCVNKIAKDDNPNTKKVVKMIKVLQDALIYKVDAETAIINMLIKKGVSLHNIVVSATDTLENPMYFSSRKASFYNEKALDGKFLVGAYYGKTFPKYKESSHVRSL